MDIFNKQKVLSLEREIQQLSSELHKYDGIRDISAEVDNLTKEKEKLIHHNDNLDKAIAIKEFKIDNIKVELKSYSDELFLYEIGMYEPIYNLNTSQEYKDKLAQCRQEQKLIILQNKAVTEPHNIYINDSVIKGRRLLKSITNTTLIAFNLQCDALINMVNGLNISKIQDKIYKLAENINKNSKVVNICIDDYYLELKIAELYITYELALKVEAEKEELKRQREILREQNLLTAELEENKKKLIKELKHYTNQLEKDVGNESIIEKIEELNGKISQNDYRVANQRAGFVYVIANDSIPNCYKIGITRRLNYEDRIAELSNASVPYKFKVHCIIFSDDCFALESALHREFTDRRVNLINTKKEFFYVPLDEIENIIKTKYEPSAVFHHDVICEDFILSEQKRLDKTK